MAIKIGCCGFSVVRERYFEQFSTVEIHYGKNHLFHV